MAIIHPTAVVDPKAELAEDVQVGPWAWIGPEVRIGAGTCVGQRVSIDGNTTIGVNCRFGNGAVVGSDPQDLKFRGEPTSVRIGDNTIVREYATVNRATGEGNVTSVGNRCFFDGV